MRRLGLYYTKIIHEFRVRCDCPVDGTEDAYDVVVEAARTIPVEEILAAADEATNEPAFQEDVTRKLATAIHCTVTTYGVHSGVQTKCEVIPYEVIPR